MNHMMFLKFSFKSKHVLDETSSIVSYTMRNKMSSELNMVWLKNELERAATKPW